MLNTDTIPWDKLATMKQVVRRLFVKNVRTAYTENLFDVFGKNGFLNGEMMAQIAGLSPEPRADFHMLVQSFFMKPWDYESNRAI